MQIYHYDSITKEYISSSQADESPLSPGEYLIPAYSTTIPIPTIPTNTSILFNNEVWEVIEDNRGTEVFDSVGNSTWVTYLGPILEGFTTTYTPSLETVKSEKISSLYSSYLIASSEPITYLNNTFQADLSSQDLISKCLSAGAVPVGFYWLDANNGEVPMTFTQLQGLALAILTRGQTAFNHLQSLKTTIKSAVDSAAVKAITW